MSRKPVDVASKERNEYIPNFISKKPFYLEGEDSQSDYLEHQRLQNSTPDQSKWYDRGKRLGPAASKFRKGACENCGAITHKRSECLSRPRAKGAKYSGKDIEFDRPSQDIELSWDAKRDRWNGYDPSEYSSVIEEYEELENLKKKAKGEGAVNQESKSLTINGNEAQAGAEEEAKYAEESDMGRQQSTATRNLRIREDTAKYLLNLDLDSAKYDPKTRSMIDMGAQADQAAALVAEDNFMRASGDAAEFERAQKYAWESQERGDKNKTHLQANPTSGEYYQRKEKEENEAKRAAHRKMLREKYGGEQYLKPTDDETMVLENERYLEYDTSGAIKGAPRPEARSKYPEDILINNHKSVWGSWWANSEWGYACCHSTVKNSYCTGEEGKRAFEEATRRRTGAELESDSKSKAVQWHDGEAVDNPLSKPDKMGADSPSKKRTVREMKDEVTEEELEAYKKSKVIADDPMSKYLGNDRMD